MVELVVEMPVLDKKNGGGGGGGSAVTRLLIPATFISDRLFVQVGVGGAGGSPGNSGTGGGNSYVSLTPVQNQTTNQLLASSTSNVGAGANSGGGGGGNAVSTVSECILSAMGILTSVAGVAGATGGASGVSGSSVSMSAATIISGGAGGGSIAADNVTAFVGGNIIGNGFIPTLSGGAIGRKCWECSTTRGLPFQPCGCGTIRYDTYSGDCSRHNC